MTESKHKDCRVTRNLMPMFFGLGMLAIVDVMITMVWPVWNLFPQYVTEQVKVV